MWNQLFHLHVIKFFSSARGISCNLCDLYDNVEVFANEKCVCFQLPDQLLIFTTSPSGTAKVKIVKNERDPPLFTSKQLISNTL